MNNDRDLMQEALEALESLQAWPETPENFKRFRAIEALRARLAQPEQEPVAYVKTVIEALYENSDPVSVEAAELLEQITTLPQREWVGLTDEELHALHFELKVQTMGGINTLGMYRILEAKLKEKNHAA